MVNLVSGGNYLYEKCICSQFHKNWCTLVVSSYQYHLQLSTKTRHNAHTITKDIICNTNHYCCFPSLFSQAKAILMVEMSHLLFAMSSAVQDPFISTSFPKPVHKQYKMSPLDLSILEGFMPGWAFHKTWQNNQFYSRQPAMIQQHDLKYCSHGSTTLLSHVHDNINC